MEKKIERERERERERGEWKGRKIRELEKFILAWN